MMNKIIYLFYGLGSEYVLNPIYKKMDQMGFNCVEIDCFKEKDSKKIINNLINKKIVFITSYHILLDKNNFNEYFPHKINFYGILEVMRLLKPIKSIYIPHDLTQPLINKEDMYVHLFDLFLSPCEPFTSMYGQYCNTVECGWIKFKKESVSKLTGINSSSGAIWFLSDFITFFRLGIKKSYELLLPVLKQNVSIKFPLWVGSDKFEKYFFNHGVKVYPSTTNTIDLIKKHKIIIANGLSSINAESYLLGKTTVNIKEKSGYADKEEYLKQLFPNIIFIDNIIDFKIESLESNESKQTLMPFDLKKAINLINFK